MTQEQGTNTETGGAKEPTQQKEEPTVYKTEEDYNKALQTAVSKGLESITTQLNLRNGEVKVAKAEADRLTAAHKTAIAQIEVLKKEAEELLIDDPEKRTAYISRINALEREQEIASKNAEAEQKLYDAEKLAWSGAMALKSIELKGKYQVPQNVLDTCITEEQMETVAKAFPEVGKEAEEPKKEPKFDTTTSSGEGTPLSGKELMKKAFDQESK